ncbi:GNAT family N-acetyltransferase [Nocardioides anomalus]|uniref:Pyruvoyl-dependent arginine decarboxylase AaxB n=1 Tax=Nocardioides anomalus TaxID=2712223 RepID=A0A6G6WEY6_9ACTN|nr:pyruvoyl-dependent arginine decarboxylase [Nocardioides anomalus]QIG43665.1 GNAT family N-acetyltransferase [Nocardioides anomalus]
MASSRTESLAAAPVTGPATTADTAATATTGGAAAKGLTISIRTGSGTGQTPLSAFDSALLDAGVGDFNLVTLSSVIPPASRIRHVDGPLAGTHGDLLFCVRAEAFADQPGHTAWAGLGWVTDDTGGGLFVEHHGTSEASVVEQIEASLDDMNRARGGHYRDLQITVASAECVDAPVCALVLAAYRVTSWYDGSEPAPAAVAADDGLVATPPAASPAAGSGPGGTHTQIAEEWIAEDHGTPAGTPRVSSNGHRPAAARPAPAPVSSAPALDPDGPVKRISVEKEVDFATAKRYYQLYVATFGQLDTEAAGRQLLTEEEFLEEMLDPRVHKYIAWDEDDKAIGMSTLATDVATLPWVSPTYFQHHWPEEFARGAIYYLGFTLVHPAHRGAGIFQLMIRTALQRVVDDRGVAAWDSCQANDERGMNATAVRLVEEVSGVTPTIVDRQTYYAGLLVGGLRETAAPDA